MNLEAINLSKKYGNKFVVSNISLKVEEGKVLGLLGPNGAGKSTIIKMISGQTHPTEGIIKINGQEFKNIPASLQPYIGIVPQDIVLWEDLSIVENLQFSSTLQKMESSKAKKSIEQLMEVLHLQKEYKSLARNLSGGYRRRLHVALSLLNSPTLLFFDEPTPGIDSQSRRLLMDFIKQLAKTENRAVLLTDHYLDEAERLSDNVIIIDNGKIIAQGTIPNLKKEIGTNNVIEVLLDSEIGENADTHNKILNSLQKTFADFKFNKHKIQIYSSNPVSTIQEITKMLDLVGVKPEYIGIKEPTLEDIFIHLTGKEIRE